MAMTMHQRARLSRGVQYAVLILVVLALIAVADWPLLVAHAVAAQPVAAEDYDRSRFGESANVSHDQERLASRYRYAARSDAP